MFLSVRCSLVTQLVSVKDCIVTLMNGEKSSIMFIVPAFPFLTVPFLIVRSNKVFFVRLSAFMLTQSTLQLEKGSPNCDEKL